VGVKIIEYSCDNEIKIVELGRHLGIIAIDCIPEDSMIPKMPVINPLQSLVHPQTQKNYPAWIVNPNPNFSEFTFFGK
jgi:hypothetical protein